jgi:hypothetical protein
MVVLYALSFYIPSSPARQAYCFFFKQEKNIFFSKVIGDEPPRTVRREKDAIYYIMLFHAVYLHCTYM